MLCRKMDDMLRKYPIILQVSTATSWRGGEQQIAYLLESLALKQVVFYVVAIKGSAMAEYCKSVNYNLIEISKKNSFDLGIVRTLAKTIRKHQINFIHTHDSHGLTISILCSIFFNVKSKIIVHRRAYFSVKNSFVKRWKYNHKSITKILCVSNAVRDLIAPIIKDKDKLKTIYSGIDINRFSNKNIHVLKEEFSINKNTQIIGNIAALTFEKDYFTFLDTAKILLERNYDLIFFIIGEGNLKAELIEYAKNLNIDQQVVFTGFRKDISNILPSLDILLFTSTKEGLGTTILDAFAAQVPVVATNSGGIPELILHKRTGLLAEPYDSKRLACHVETLLTDKKMKTKVIESASHHLNENFVNKHMAKKIIELYRNLKN
jgi:glycosyltransferase involved in cell wall biosynthesis